MNPEKRPENSERGSQKSDPRREMENDENRYREVEYVEDSEMNDEDLYIYRARMIP